ncbi:MAG: sulfite exporter TauE/SafE family protein [bacterium]|nr:sulfite exporter TauE/SafE family protein [bacterium]
MSDKNQKTLVFHVSGMHCSACILMTESELMEVQYVTRAKSSLKTNSVEVTGEFGDKSPEEVAEELSLTLRPHGYELSVEKMQKNAGWGDFTYAVPISVVIILAFLLLQKAGLTSLITSSNVSYSTAFIIGLIASVSTCLAIVGGLVLSLSASSAKEGGTWRTQTLFHIGRLGGFFILGGLVGLLGNSMHLGLTANVVLGSIVALVMLILGVNLLDVFHFTKKFQFTLPTSFSRHILNGSKPSTKSDLVLGKHDHYLAPVLVGVGTFFLPCGFTQSMQLYALSTGSFMQGALTMTVFALGTFPVLALLSFGSVNIAHKPWKGVFFKTAGIIVISLALLNLANALATAGIISPLFNF